MFAVLSGTRSGAAASWSKPGKRLRERACPEFMSGCWGRSRQRRGSIETGGGEILLFLPPGEACGGEGMPRGSAAQKDLSTLWAVRGGGKFSARRGKEPNGRKVVGVAGV